MPHMDLVPNPFREASLDRSLTVLELFDINAGHSPNHPLFVFEVNGVVQTVQWKQFVNAVDHAAHFVLDSTNGITRDEATSPVIGILATSDAITHYTFGYGVLRAGYPVFLISTRNSPAAIAQLLHKTKCYHIFVSEDAAMQGACSTAAAVLANQSHPLSVYKMPHYADLYTSDELPFPLPAIKARRDLDTLAIILHSSGSTAFPKPVYVSHRILMQWIRDPNYANDDLSHDILALHAPMYHAMGIVMGSWTASTGMTVACFPPVFPPIQPTPDAVLRSVIETKSTIVYGVPSFYEHWAENPENLAHLSRLKALVYAGAPLSDAVGNLLVKNNVPVLQMYGCTETGCATVFAPRKNRPENWAYMIIAPQLNYALAPQDDEGFHELVILGTEDRQPCVYNTVLDGKQAYGTNDILVQHPTNPELWKIHGRKDDQLMLSTGEKTNPGPIGKSGKKEMVTISLGNLLPYQRAEAALCRDPRIAFAVMFGRGKEMNGVIIQPRPEYVFDPSDTEALAAFRNNIWPTVEKANAAAPQHSRLFKEMILVAPPEKPFDLTAKGTPRRSFVIAAYDKEIEKAYDAVRESSQSDITPPSHWETSEILTFTREIVHKTMNVTIGDEADLFQHGCDSLQATWIRNTIRHALRHSSDVPVRDIPQGLVFENPSVSTLAQFITRLFSLSSKTPSASDEANKTIKHMRELVGEFSQRFPVHRPSATRLSGDVVLVTGTTGGLGAHLLSQLIVLPEISRVYAINRQSRNHNYLQERQKYSFDDRGLDISLLSSPKLVMVETDTSLPALGLDESLYNEIRDSVTHIVHNAWRVDFRISLPSFRPFVQSVRNLIELALGSPLPSPPALLFMSSVGVLRNWNSAGMVPEAPVDAAIAVGSGYSESKWVAETVLQAAAHSTALHPTIIRIDQLSGAENGSWNHTDSIPAIVRSGQVLGCLPDRNDEIAWLPVNVAAASIIDIRDSGTRFIHLRNPWPASWHDVFKVISTQLGIRLVPYAEWLSRLIENNEALESGTLDIRKTPNNPAILLIDFYKSLNEDRGPVTSPMDMTQALQKSRSLRKPTLQSALSEREVKKWVGYWTRKGFLEG